MDEQLFQQKLRSTLLPAWEQLPDFGLYMDQVMTYAEKCFAGVAEAEQKLMTPAMMNNYVKGGLVDRPVGKKYSRDSLAQLLMLCLEGWEAQPEENTVYMQQMKLILQGCLRSGDPFTQIGAGQYWVLLPGAGSETHSAIAQRLQQAMHQRFAQSSAVFRTRAIDLRGMVHLAEPKD